MTQSEIKSTEEKEFEKCTFSPQLYKHQKKYRDIDARFSPTENWTKKTKKSTIVKRNLQLLQ